MDNPYRLIFEYDDVIGFLKLIGITTFPEMNFKKTINKINKIAFEQNLKASLPTLKVDNGKSIIFRPNDSKKITLRKIKVPRDSGGKSNGYRCYVILDELNEFMILTSIYTHSAFDNLPQKDLKTLKAICKTYQVISEGTKNEQ